MGHRPVTPSEGKSALATVSHDGLFLESTSRSSRDGNFNFIYKFLFPPDSFLLVRERQAPGRLVVEITHHQQLNEFSILGRATYGGINVDFFY